MHLSNSKLFGFLSFVFLTTFFICQINSISAQTLSTAKELAYAGKHAEADSIIQLLLNENPDDLEIRIMQAYNHSWQGNLKVAREEFESILKTYPDNKSALIGYGYTLAWLEDFANAKYPFITALNYYPHDEDAKKGLAYVYLWQQSPDVAMDMFNELQASNPSNTEYNVALAYAHLQKFETKNARDLVDQAILMQPDNKSISELKNALEYATPFAEADILAGYSKIADQSKFGLRALQIQAQLTRNFRAIVSYDNAMSFDNPFFIGNALRYETFSAGGILSWNKSKNASRLQLAYRDLNLFGSQWLVIGEQALHLRDNKVLKLGGLFGAGNVVPEEWMLYAGINFPVSKAIRLEPVYYISKRSNAAKSEHRFALHSQWKSSHGVEINLGGYFGFTNVSAEEPSGNVYGSFLSALIPVHRMFWLEGSFRNENGPFGNSIIGALGVKLRFEK